MESISRVFRTYAEWIISHRSVLIAAFMLMTALFLRGLEIIFKPRFIFADKRRAFFGQSRRPIVGTRAVPTAVLASLVVLAIFSAAWGTVGAADMSAHDMMQKNFFVSKIKSLKSTATMLLVNDQGQTRERKSITVSVLQPNGIDSKLLVKFSSPADIKGTAFLQIEHIEADDDEWIYLPALGKSRRLVANNKKDSFVGSDFSYGDVSLPSVDLYEHRLLGSEAIDGQDCYKVESTPKTEATKANSGYSRKITWLRKDNYLETKVEYYDLSGRLLKSQLVTKPKLLEPDSQRWIALHREMKNAQTGHSTVLNFDEVQAGVATPDDQFTSRYLERE